MFLLYLFLVSIVNPFLHSVNKGGNYTLFWGLSVPGEVLRRSASALALLARFLNSAANSVFFLEIYLYIYPLCLFQEITSYVFWCFNNRYDTFLVLFAVIWHFKPICLYLETYFLEFKMGFENGFQLINDVGVLNDVSSSFGRFFFPVFGFFGHFVGYWRDIFWNLRVKGFK